MEQNRIDPEKTGKFIAALRKAHNMTQDQLGEKLFITRKAVSKWETGRACPSIDMLKLLSETLGVSLDDIIEGDFDKIEALLNNDNVLYKTNPPPEPKTGGKTIIISIIIVIIIFLMSNLKATKIYSIASEDDTYSIDNGVLVLSDVRSYIDLGTIYSNDDGLNGNSKYRYELYYKEKDNEKFILECGASRMVDIPKESKKLIMEILSKPKNNLFLKITKLDDMSEKQLNLLVGEKKSFDSNRFNTVAFGELVLGKYQNDILSKIAIRNEELHIKNDNESQESNLNDSIDFSFLYQMDISTIKNIYHDEEVRIGSDVYNIIFNNSDDSLCIKNNLNTMCFRFFTPSIKIGNNMFYNLPENKILTFEDSNLSKEEYIFVQEVEKILSSLNATFGSVSE